MDYYNTPPPPKQPPINWDDPQSVRCARLALGLSCSQLAFRLRLTGDNASLTIRRWESGKVKITGPAQVAIEYMLSEV